MERGTTPLHTFNIPPDVTADTIKEVKVVYSQANKIILTKRKADCIIEDGKLIIKLSQEETFQFDSMKLVYIQIRILTTLGDCYKSKVIATSVGDCLDDEVLV